MLIEAILRIGATTSDSRPKPVPISGGLTKAEDDLKKTNGSWDIEIEPVEPVVLKC